jgi:DUF1680 family protein
MQSEAFGEPYELPADICYCETCAQIASIMWNWRMLLITGEGRYADLMERTLFNGFLSGLALDGVHTRYENPLMRRGFKTVFGPHGNERQEWFGCACCPPNIMRLLSSLTHYMATSTAQGVQIHQYAPFDLSASVAGGKLHLHTQTDYPWQGTIMMSVEQAPAAPWALSLRIPAWCARPTVKLNDALLPVQVDGSGYVVIERKWSDCDLVELELPMTPRLTASHPRVDATRGCAAIERGPLVYCLESPDQPDGINFMDIVIAKDAFLDTVWKDDMLDGVVIVKTHGYVLNSAEWGDSLYRPLTASQTEPNRLVSLVAIPYYVWDNRGLSTMRVWIPYR